ncbi:MAG: hypothetical protein NC203_07935 [Firmicutes bacterium]|nr:hypothetical protein [[Eubacterium] siraeum]MCM1488279.1 hypothetical protein [Bacillota bacterium]
MLITILFWILTIAVIVKMTKDTVKEMCEEYDYSKVDFERLIFDLDESETPEFWVEIRLLRGKYDFAETAEEGEEYIDESRKAC